METLTMAQALRHMAERAEAGSDTPWEYLQILRHGTWVSVSRGTLLTDLMAIKLRLKPHPKLVNGVECHPHREKPVFGEWYYIPTPLDPKGYGKLKCDYHNREMLALAHSRSAVYTSSEAALVEARAQGWV